MGGQAAAASASSQHRSQCDGIERLHSVRGGGEVHFAAELDEEEEQTEAAEAAVAALPIRCAWPSEAVPAASTVEATSRQGSDPLAGCLSAPGSVISVCERNWHALSSAPPHPAVTARDAASDLAQTLGVGGALSMGDVSAGCAATARPEAPSSPRPAGDVQQTDPPSPALDVDALRQSARRALQAAQHHHRCSDGAQLGALSAAAAATSLLPADPTSDQLGELLGSSVGGTLGTASSLLAAPHRSAGLAHDDQSRARPDSAVAAAAAIEAAVAATRPAGRKTAAELERRLRTELEMHSSMLTLERELREMERYHSDIGHRPVSQ